MSLVIDHPTRKDVQSMIDINMVSMPEHYRAGFWTVTFNQFGEFCFVAKEDDKVVGYILCRKELVDNVMTGIVISIAVDKEHRSRGIGEKLLRESTRAFRLAGLSMAGLVVRKSNIPALKLYEKLGYATTLTLPSYYSNPEEDGLLQTLVL